LEAALYEPVVGSFFSQQSDRLVDALLMLGTTRQRIDRSQLHRDLEHLVQQYYGQPLREIALGSLLREAFTIIQRHHLHLPPNLAPLCKALIMDEGLGSQLDPNFNLADLLAPYARQLLLQQYAPSLWFQRIGQASLDATRLGVEFSQQLRRLLRELEDGDLEIAVRPAALEPLVRRFEQAINRLVFGMLVAAFVNGLAILTLAYLDHPFGAIAWVDALFLLGFVLASAFAVFLAWSILRFRGER
jgi:ubiquinone biosynthesis protein